jgi:hypothetical protein
MKYQGLREKTVDEAVRVMAAGLWEAMDALRQGVELTRNFLGQDAWESCCNRMPEIKRINAVLAAFDGIAGGATPSSKWAANGEPDPHGNHYDCERAALACGTMTDDELANAVFVYDHRLGFESIKLLTAAKDRIRWLSRRLADATSKLEPRS